MPRNRMITLPTAARWMGYSKKTTKQVLSSWGVTLFVLTWYVPQSGPRVGQRIPANYYVSTSQIKAYFPELWAEFEAKNG